MAGSTSWASSTSTRASMQGNRCRDTIPELALRRAVHRLGLRFRVAVRPVAGVRRTADFVFSKVRVAVFLDGCYWHGCMEHFQPPHTNTEFWSSKIEGNRLRDRETDALLEENGWAVIRIWEHEDAEAAARLVRATVLGKHEMLAAKAPLLQGE
jgi:DNA mismatch endonuclease (patch repair protein)